MHYRLAGADPGFGQGGAPASEAKNCRRSEVESCKRSEPLAAGVQGPLKGPGSFWVFNAQICILLHSRDSFSLILTASSTHKIIHYIVFYIFMKNCVFVCLRYAERSEARNVFDIMLTKISFTWLVTHCFSLKCPSMSSPYMLQEIKYITKSNWGLGIPMWAKTPTFNLHWLRNDMLSEARLKNFRVWIMKIRKKLYAERSEAKKKQKN